MGWRESFEWIAGRVVRSVEDLVWRLILGLGLVCWDLGGQWWRGCEGVDEGC